MKVITKLIIILIFFVIGLYVLINYLHHKHNSGWTKENIRSLSKAIYEKIKDSPVTTMCISQNNADCIANAISTNYPYDSKYEENPLLNIPKKYITQCFSSCLGIKGNWSNAFYKEMVDTLPKTKISNPECYIKYLEENLDPIDLLDPDFDNKNKDLINNSLRECNVPVPSGCPSNCKGKSCGVDECVGSCGTCPNNIVCSDDGTCNGWNIEELANVLQNTDYIYQSFKNLCINPDSAKCLATSIASDNYNLYPGPIASQKDVIKYTPKYFGKCLKDGCAGIKGAWNQYMYNEIADGQICLYNYLQSHIDPVEFITDNIYAQYYNSDDPDATQKITDIATDGKKSCGIE
jgi:hypothetical protein